MAFLPKSFQLYEVGTLVTCISPLERRPREGKQPTGGHTAETSESGILILVYLALKPVFSTMTLPSSSSLMLVAWQPCPLPGRSFCASVRAWHRPQMGCPIGVKRG